MTIKGDEEDFFESVGDVDDVEGSKAKGGGSSEEQTNKTSALGANRMGHTGFECPPLTKRAKISLCALFVIIFIVLMGILAASLKKLQTTEYGVEYNVHKKVLADAAETGGLHIGPPGYRFIKYPSTQITVDLPTDTCVSRDGLRVEVEITFQYQIAPEWVLPVTTKYRNFDSWATLVEKTGASAIQHTCSDFSVVDFQKSRSLIQQAMERELSIRLEGPLEDGESGVYAIAIALQLRNVEVPEEYWEAVYRKQVAQEDIELARNQRSQEITKAQTELLSAREEARKILDSAQNEANITLTESLLKAAETQYAFQNEAETIVRVKTAMNLTTDGVLAFMTNQLVERVPNLKVTAGEPAKLSRKDEL